jgi:hypothetical protein
MVMLNHRQSAGIAKQGGPVLAKAKQIGATRLQQAKRRTCAQRVR